jgi:predicted dienelactone hydrolase
MRPIEALVLLAILFSLLADLVSGSRRPRWSSRLPALAALLVAIHLVVEGYRWQMVPAYILGAFLVLRMVLRERKSARPRVPTPSRARRILRILGVAVGFIAGLTVLALAALFSSALPVFSLPEPSGPYAVGTRYYLWTDTRQPDEYTSAPDDFRQVSVQIWYPAEPSRNDETIPYMSRAAARAFSSYQNFPPFLFEQLALVRTHAYLGAEVARKGAPFPVVTYSESGVMSAHMTLFEELASHGYVVVCIGHPHWLPFVYGSNGEPIPLDEKNELYQAYWTEANSTRVLDAKAQVTEAKTTAAQERAFVRLNDLLPFAVPDLRRWADDIGFVLDQLDTLNQESGPLLGALDLQRVGVMGFSKGGAAAGQFCLTDPRCSAGINLTGFMYGDILELDLQVPFLFIDEEELWCPDCYPNDLFFRRAGSHAYQMKIRGARHSSFGDYPLFVWLIQPAGDKPAIDVQRMILIQNAYSMAFFDKHLKGMTSALLDGPSADFPEVVFMSNRTTP